MPAITLYGIPNCDTVKKARHWLERHNIDYTFVDFRATPLARKKIVDWVAHSGWEPLLNTRSRTWRELPAAEKQVTDTKQAIDLMCAHVTLIKRPVLESARGLLIGFDAKAYAALS